MRFGDSAVFCTDGIDAPVVAVALRLGGRRTAADVAWLAKAPRARRTTG
jgi:hypothetical protein